MDHILVIEDEDVYMTNIVTFLEREYPGFQVTQCWNTGSFLEVFEARSDFRLVITDMSLPLFKPSSSENFPVELNELEIAYPLVAKNWEGQKAGERIVEHIRRTKQSLVPIIIQSSTPSIFFQHVFQYPNIVVCDKSLHTALGLAYRIRKALSKP